MFLLAFSYCSYDLFIYLFKRILVCLASSLAIEQALRLSLCMPQKLFNAWDSARLRLIELILARLASGLAIKQVLKRLASEGQGEQSFPSCCFVSCPVCT